MAAIDVHPAESDADHDSLAVILSVRVLILDISTGQPLQGAIAVDHGVDQRLLDVRGEHPFVVTESSTVKLWNNDTGEYSIKVKSLRTFKTKNSGADGPESLKATWKRVDECFFAERGGIELLNESGDTEFVQLRGEEDRFVAVKSAGKTYAKRDVASDHEGVVDVPLRATEWTSGKKVKIKLRDYKLVAANGAFAPRPDDHDTIGDGLSLEGTPTDNSWKLTIGGATVEFQDEITIDVSPMDMRCARVRLEGVEDFSTAGLPTFWAVRKVVEATDPKKTIPGDRNNNPATGTTWKPRGIVIHFNSGLAMKEVRGSTKKKLKKALEDGENQFFFDIGLVFGLLKALYPSRKVGYHYHILRKGEIHFVVDEDRRARHAGWAREPTSATATAPSGDPPRTITEDITNPYGNVLDHPTIGIDIIGNNKKPAYHFNAQQEFYLDKLIDNIMSRRSEVSWKYIYGHDETREALNLLPAWNEDPKPDPGAALSGGMEQLRWRHGGKEAYEALHPEAD